MKRAVLLVVAALMLTSGVQANEGTATVVVFPQTPPLDLCRAEPVDQRILIGLAAFPKQASPVASTDLEGAPADAATVAAVQAMILEVFACLNAGEPLRAYALYSDRYLASVVGAQPIEIIDRLATPTPLDPRSWTAVIDVRDVRTLAGGQVYATVILDPALIPVEKFFGFFFVEVDGRWLVDEVLDELTFSLP